jgi:hypothetical protein
MDYSGAMICVVGLEWAPGAAGPASAVVKFVDPADALGSDLAGAGEARRICRSCKTRGGVVKRAGEAKVARTLRSYANEVAVLRDVCGPLAAAGVRVPAVYAVEMDRPAGARPPRTLAVLECCTPEFAQIPVLERALAAAALGWLAQFHALGHALRAEGALAESGLWPAAGHTALANRPPDEVGKVAVGFDALRANFAAAGPDFAQPAPDLGARLQASHGRCSHFRARLHVSFATVPCTPNKGGLRA